MCCWQIYVLLVSTILPGSQSTTVIQVGTYVLSQKALYDAPERYASFVVQALQEANSYRLDDIIEEHSCSTSYWIWASRCLKTFTIAPGTLKSVITATGLLVTATIDAYIKSPTTITFKTNILFWCFESNVCPGNAALTLRGQFSLSVAITAKWDSSNITITAKPEIQNMIFHVNGCSPPWWMRLIANVNTMINHEIQNAIDAAIARNEQKINIPGTFTPYPGIYFTYRITSITFARDDRILASANCIVEADRKNPDGSVSRLSFDASDPSKGAATFPPKLWDLGLVEGKLYQLQGIRLSSTILEAFFWGAQTIGAFNTSFSSPFLDTEVTLNSQFTPPLTGVNSDNQLTVTIEQGRIFATCKGLSGTNSKMIDISFRNLAGNGSVYATPDKIGVIMHILAFNIDGNNIEIDWPPLPLSPAFVEAIERIALNNTIPKMNRYFEDHPLRLPPDIAELIPNPKLTLRNQDGCCGGKHGYLDFASYCSMVKDGSQWTICGFAPNKATDMLALAATYKQKQPVATSGMSPSKFMNSDSNGIYMIQYGSEQCLLLCGENTNHAALTYIAIVTADNCTHTVSPDFNLSVALRTRSGVQVGMYCNDSCSIASCLASIDNAIPNKCYPEHSAIFFDRESIELVVGNDSVVVSSFGVKPINTCDISESYSITFTSICSGEECQPVGVIAGDEDVFLDMESEKFRLVSYCVNCSNCQKSIESPVGTCVNLITSVFELFTKDNLPSTFKLKYLIVRPPGPPDPLVLVFSIVGPLFVILLLLVVFKLRRKIPRFSGSALDKNLTLLSNIISDYIYCLPEKLKSSAQRLLEKLKSFGQRLITRTVHYGHSGLRILRITGRWIKDKSTRMLVVISSYCEQRRRIQKFPLSVEVGGSMFSFTISCTVLTLWITNDPFYGYVHSVIENIGISEDVLCETDRGSEMLNLWANLVNVGIIGITLLNVFTMCVTFILDVQDFAMVIFFIELVVGFSVIHIPPMFLKFEDMISFGPATNGTMPEFVGDFLEPKIKTAFMSMGIASMANWNLFWLQGLLAGCVSACVLFWITSDYSTIAQRLPAVIGITLPMAIAVPLTSIIAIIFLYQSFGVDVFWMITWLLWWIVSIAVLTIVIYSTVKQKRSGDNTNISNKSTTESWLVFVVYVITLVIVLAYAAYRESNLTTTNVAFAIGIWILPMGSSLPLLYIFLMRKSPIKLDDQHERQPLIIDTENSPEEEVIISGPRTTYAPATELEPVVVAISPTNTEDTNSDDLLRTTKSGKCSCTGDFRTSLFVIGTFCMAVGLFMTLNDYAHNSVMDYIMHFLQKENASLTWPKNGTVFDAAISLYEKSRWDQLFCSFASFVTLVCAVLFCFIQCKHSSTLSKLFGYLSVFGLFIGLLIVSSPNYLDAMHVERYLPNCTAQCNKVFTQSVKTTIGLACAIIFTAKVSVLAFTFPTALARASGLLFTKKICPEEKESLLLMWLGAPFYGILMTIIPIVFVMQTIGNNIVLFIILCFWLGPLIVSVIVVLLRLKYSFNHYLVTSLTVIIWSAFYIGSAVALMFYSVYLYDLWDLIVDMLWSIDMWAFLFAEFAISLAVPADFIDSFLKQSLDQTQTETE